MRDYEGPFGLSRLFGIGPLTRRSFDVDEDLLDYDDDRRAPERIIRRETFIT